MNEAVERKKIDEKYEKQSKAFTFYDCLSAFILLFFVEGATHKWRM